MANESHQKLTFDGLQAFLRDIGFDQSVKLDNSLALQHRDSGTIVVVTIPTDGRTVRSADLMSILMRLESDGLVDDVVLAQFRDGKLPKAS